MTRFFLGQGLTQEDDNKGHELDASSLHGPGIYVRDKSCKCVRKENANRRRKKAIQHDADIRCNAWGELTRSSMYNTEEVPEGGVFPLRFPACLLLVAFLYHLGPGFIVIVIGSSFLSQSRSRAAVLRHGSSGDRG